MADKSLPVLLAEDNDADVFFVERALNKGCLPIELVVTRDGQQAIDYLARAILDAGRDSHPLPGLFLLDLKMPGVDGFDVLAWIKTQPALQQLPVVVLSSSVLESDIKKARQLGVVDYVEKTSDFDLLTRILQRLHDRWLT